MPPKQKLHIAHERRAVAPVRPQTPEAVRDVQMRIAERATSTEDARLLLEHLGLFRRTGLEKG